MQRKLAEERKNSTIEKDNLNHLCEEMKRALQSKDREMEELKIKLVEFSH